jgi:hypothetical protein
VGTQSDIRDQRYRTEPDIGTSDIGLKCIESDIIADIGIDFYSISDIQRLQLPVAQWYDMTPNQRYKDCGFESSDRNYYLTEFFSSQLGIIYQF